MKKKLINYSNPIAKILYFISLGVVAAAIIMIFLFLYWIVAPINVLQIKNTPIPIERKYVRAGDVQIVDINYCKNSDIKGYVIWELVGEKNVIILPSYQDTNTKGCNANLRVPLILPNIPYTDKYYLHWSVTYQVNPIRSSMVQFNSQEFTVIGKDSL